MVSVDVKPHVSFLQTFSPKVRTSTQSYLPPATVSKMADRVKGGGDFCGAISCTNARNKTKKAVPGNRFSDSPKTKKGTFLIQFVNFHVQDRLKHFNRCLPSCLPIWNLE